MLLIDHEVSQELQRDRRSSPYTPSCVSQVCGACLAIHVLGSSECEAMHSHRVFSRMVQKRCINALSCDCDDGIAVALLRYLQASKASLFSSSQAAMDATSWGDPAIISKREAPLNASVGFD
jgi:hypothetical protein